MSWLDKTNTDYIISCGDGKQYTVDWLNANIVTEWNIAQYEFSGVPGSLVKKSQPKGRVYNVEIIFQGDDHLDTAAAFRDSADHPEAWTIRHPLYGNLVVQPSSLTYDNGNYNITRIVGTVTETIGTEAVTIKVSPPNKIKEDKLIADTAMTDTFAQDIPVKKVSVLQQLKKNVDQVFNNISSQIPDTDDLSDFQNKYNEALSLISAVGYNATELISQVQALISMPAQFIDDLANRVAMIKQMLSLLNSGVATITTRDGKKIYENNAGTVITTLVVNSITNIGTAYSTRTDVINAINTIYTAYTGYIGNLDLLQTTTGGTPDSYIPDPDAVTAISELVGYAIVSLSGIATNSRQERWIYLENDSDPIQLTHRFYRLKADDSTLNEFIDSNKLERDELFEIKKGRKILYYV